VKSRFLAAAASIAFIASGVVAQAQEPPKHDQRPAAERAEPNGGATHEQAAPRAAQAEPRHDEMKGANPAGRAEGERNEPKAQGAERPRAAEAPGQERKAVQGQNEQRPAAEGKRSAEPNGEKSPAARTGAKEEERNAPRTGAKEEERNAPRTGANEQERNAPRTAEHNEGRGPARVQGNVKMSTEHASRVSQSLLRESHREHSNVRVRVGERVPEGIRYLPLPEDVVAIVPEYRGYDYFIDENDEIVFISPQTHEVAGMIDFEGRAASDDTYTRVPASRPCPTEP
jgi:hypothetical protein